MKGKMVVGALLVSVMLASQGFGFDLRDRLSGLNCGGCGTCKACDAPAPCGPAVKACAPEPACSQPACNPCAKRCDLFKGLRDMFACRRCGKVNCACEPAPKACEPACARPAFVKPCEPACAKPACVKPCDPVCAKPACVKPCDPVCAKPACEKPCRVQRRPACPKPCAKPACAQPACDKGCSPEGCRCGRHLGHGLVINALNKLLTCEKKCGDGCGTGCAIGCGGAPAAPAAPAAAPAPPAKPASDEAAPLPIAPTVDPSASLMRPRTIYQASRIVAQN